MNSQVHKIAAFPLNLIVLPGEEIPLRIFEPRYKQLVEECIESSLPFGIPYINSETMTEIGSEVEILKVVGKNANGDMVITIRGKENFKTLNFLPELPNKLYGGSIVEMLTADFSSKNPEIAVIVKMLKLNLSSELGTLIISDSINILDIAKSLMLKSEDKYKLLTINDKEGRENFILNQLRFVELIRKQEARLENNFQLN
jgi:hypothetical protein